MAEVEGREVTVGLGYLVEHLCGDGSYPAGWQEVDCEKQCGRALCDGERWVVAVRGRGQ